MRPEVVAAIIAASVSFLILIGSLLAQIFGYRNSRYHLVTNNRFSRSRRGTLKGHDPSQLRLLPIGWALAICFAAAVIGLTGLTLLAMALLHHPKLPTVSPISLHDLISVFQLVFASVAGAGALVALVMAYRRQRVAETATVHDRTRMLNERFTTIAGQLGDQNPAVRMAGVHGLAGLADDWPENRQTCVDILCAYLRLPYEPKGQGDDGATVSDSLAFRNNRELRHTAIRVIAAHLQPGAIVSWQGLNLDFTYMAFDGGYFDGAVFSGGMVNFGGATFADGNVSFDNALFCGGRVDFGGATFSGCTATFDNAVFSGGTVNFGGATFSGGTTRFRMARFSGSTFNFGGARISGGTVSFDDAAFSGGLVNFGGARISGGTVKFGGAEFSSECTVSFGASFSAGTVIFDDAAFDAGHVSFGGAVFSGGTVSFDKVKFGGPRWGGYVEFGGAVFSGGTVSFDNAQFSRGRVEFGSTLYFPGAVFSGGTVRFDNAVFSGGSVDFRGEFTFGRNFDPGGAVFSGGTVSFDNAVFSGGMVNFDGDTGFPAVFSGGIVDFSRVGEWSSPPMFTWAGSPPPGVKLPPADGDP
jgi:uncharacterized protein YjbI with pentapeptide repeats